VAAHAEQSFKIAVSGKPDASKADFGLTHGSHLVLVDAAGDIRGYYASMDEATPERLLGDLDQL
jgi:protein SCO1